MNNSSQTCTGSIAKFNSLEAQIDNSNSSERNCVSPVVINCTGCHQELKAFGNMALETPEKDEIIHKVDCSSNGLHGTSVEARSLTHEVSASEDSAGRGAGSELSSLNLKANDISQATSFFSSIML